MFNEIKNSFRNGSMLGRLIYLNLIFFVSLKVLVVVLFLFNITTMNTNDFLGLAADSHTVFKKPWTLLSYMFVHNDFIHLIFNLLWLYFGGSIFLRYLNSRQLLSTYILGGVVGGLFYIFAFNYFPAFKDALTQSTAIGASASVLAILIGIATYAPNYNVNLTLVGTIKLKYIAIASVILDLILIPDGNAGGHIAHLGGAFYGFLFARQLSRGKDISIWFNTLISFIVSSFNSRPKMKTVHKTPMTDDQWRENKVQKQNEINQILDKIAQSGYESLTKNEKDILFRESKK